jgi:PLD-like domain
MTTDAHYSLRRIFKSAVTSRKTIQELIALMIVAELIDPGEEFWIVSPWISDVPLLDNRAGTFDVMNPEWGRREVRLVNLATQLMAGGSRFIVVTRPGDHNKVFLRCLREAAVDAAVEASLTTIVRDHLHTKGILTKRGLMLGSMNLTYSGLELNDEIVEYDVDPASLANARLAFVGYYEADS